jgi:predicted lactoylglutathione lyase
MSPNNIWLNLPVKDMAHAKAFYRAIGLKENERHAGNDQVGSFLVGPHDFVIMLFPEDVFATYTGLPVTDTATSSETLINLGAASRAEVDELAQAVRTAGGTLYTEPQLVQGWMYIFGFADPDGHRWSVLFMEERKD